MIASGEAQAFLALSGVVTFGMDVESDTRTAPRSGQ